MEQLVNVRALVKNLSNQGLEFDTILDCLPVDPSVKDDINEEFLLASEPLQFNMSISYGDDDEWIEFRGFDNTLILPEARYQTTRAAVPKDWYEYAEEDYPLRDERYQHLLEPAMKKLQEWRELREEYGV